ncbi:hypothetical protein J4Q44_G00047690 [Coregonus suidteri]|uniref:Ig-like domain-containing protein n=1 Tax=Coregonus suidteri TaxID=861788 RepID=A0AAN8MGD5_9TELE
MATLHCRAEGPLVEYRWSWPDHQGEMWSQEQTGQHYNIKSPESDSYSCEARNPVSEKTQTYNSNDCLATGNPYIYIGIGAGVLLLVSVVVVVVVWLIKKHSKADTFQSGHDIPGRLDLQSTGNGSHLEEDREKVVAISQAEIVEEENKLLQDEELTSVKDRVNRINQTSGEGKGEKKPLLDKAGSTDTDVIESNSPFKLNNQNQVLGWESGKRQREEKEQSAESKQNMNVTLGTVTEGSGPTAPSKPPRSSLNFNSPYPQTLETQHSREHHGGGPDQSMGGYGTEREGEGAGDGEGDGQLMSQKVLVLDTREESGGKEAGTREDREDEEKEEGPSSVEYRWSWPDHEAEMWSQEQTGQHYNIKSPESDSYTCEARNPVSEKTQTYNSNDCLATDPVSQPEVTCELNCSMATLRCSVKGPSVEYHWSWPDHQGEMWSQDQTGQHYNITFPESGSYTCEARNPAVTESEVLKELLKLDTKKNIWDIHSEVESGQRTKRRNPAEPHTTAKLTVRGLHQPLREGMKMERPEREEVIEPNFSQTNTSILNS